MSACAKFGARISRLRQKRHWSTKDLAKQAQMSYQNVWRIERGVQGEPGVFTAAKLAEALGCTLDYLVGMHEEEKDKYHG